MNADRRKRLARLQAQAEELKDSIKAIRDEEENQTESGLPPDIDLESLSLEELDTLTAPDAF